MSMKNICLFLFLLFAFNNGNSVDNSKDAQYELAKKFIDGLYQQAVKDAQAGKKLTQSQAHLASMLYVSEKNSFLPMRDQILYKYGKLKNFIVPNQRIIKNAFQQERSFRDNPPDGKRYYVFYTAIPYMHVMQDLAKKLYIYDFEAKGALQHDAFQFLRYFHNDPFYSQYKNVQEFLDAEIRKEKIIDDLLLRNKIILLATNLAFFGNVGVTGESTFFYFNKPQKWTSPNPLFIEDALNSYGFLDVKDYVQSFLTIINNDLGYKLNEGITDVSSAIDPNPSPGSDLFQIFIPEELVDQIGYKSWRQGIPFDIEFIRTLFPEKLPDKRTLDDSKKIIRADIDHIIEQVKSGVLPANVAAIVHNPAFSLRDYIKNTFVNVYIDKNTQADNLINFVQARILITNDFLLNPESGIYIYRYSSIPEENLIKYQQDFDQTFNDMVSKEAKQEARFDVQLINILIKHNHLLTLQDPLAHLTQTQVLLSWEQVAQKVKQLATAVHKNQRLIFSLLDREKQYDNDYYVFYLASPYMRLFQDVAIFLHKNVNNQQLQDFLFLRFDINDPLYAQYQNVNQLLIDELNKNCIIDDRRDHRIKSLLLSTNLSLFGNIDIAGESTWGFFNIPQAWAALNKAFVQPMLQDFGFSEDIVDEIMNHADLLKDASGSMPSELIQIFIPKRIVDQVAYICWSRGIPFDVEYVKALSQFVGFVPQLVIDTFGDSIAASLPSSGVGTFRKLVATVENSCHKTLPQSIVDNLIAKVQQGQFYPSKILENMTGIEKEAEYEHYQARILFTKEGMLNPASGIKMFRYSQLTPTQEHAYNDALDAALNKILQEKKNKKTTA